MNKDNYYLVYINEVGQNWEEDYIYEFLFSNTTENVDGEGWDEFPASGKPFPPAKDLISVVGKLNSELKFDLIQNSDTFSVWDAVDGMIAMGWEDISDYEEYPEKRLYFLFGEKLNSVEDKLYSRDIKLKIKTLGKNEKLKERTN